MTKNLDNEGLRSIADNYDLFYIDLWGVIHNGINLHQNAILVVQEILKLNKNTVLLTNAPRPNKIVRNFLEKMGMEKNIRDHVYVYLTEDNGSETQIRRLLLKDTDYTFIGKKITLTLDYADYDNLKTKPILEVYYTLIDGFIKKRYHFQ